MEAHAWVNILNEPAVTYNPNKASTLQAMPGPHPQGADLLGFLEQCPSQGRPAQTSTDTGPGGEQVPRPVAAKGAPVPRDMNHGTCPTRPRSGRPPRGVRMRGAWMAAQRATHARPFLRGNQEFPGRPEPSIPPLAPTIIISNLNAPLPDDNLTGPPTATYIALRDAMHQLGLTDPTAGLTGTPSHYPDQAGTHPSCIDTCNRDPTTVCVHEARYGDLPPAGTGHRQLFIDLILPNLPPAAATMPDNTLPPTLWLPAEDDDNAWHRYNGALHTILRRADAQTLTNAMRQGAQACGMERNISHTGTPPDVKL